MTLELQPLNINKQELLQLLQLSGNQTDSASPLTLISTEAKTTNPVQPGDTLYQTGWLDKKTSGLNVQANAVLMALMQPKTVVQLLLGDLKEILVTELYSANGFTDHNLVIFTEQKSENRYVIRPDISPSHISDALLEHLMIGPRLEALEFTVTLNSKNAFLFFSILDWIHTARLSSKLHNDRQLSFAFTPQNIWQRAMEIQMGDDLMWYSALLPYLFPYVEFSIVEEQLPEQLDELCESGYLDHTENDFYTLNDFMISLADALAPILSFGSCAIRQMDEDVSGFHLAFIVGSGTNLVLEIASGTEEQNWLQMSAVNGIELSKLLYRIGLPEDLPLEIPVAADKQTIKNEIEIEPVKSLPAQENMKQFCSNCGAELRSGVRFCPKCGHQQRTKETS